MSARESAGGKRDMVVDLDRYAENSGAYTPHWLVADAASEIRALREHFRLAMEGEQEARADACALRAENEALRETLDKAIRDWESTHFVPQYGVEHWTHTARRALHPASEDA